MDRITKLLLTIIALLLGGLLLRPLPSPTFAQTAPPLTAQSQPQLSASGGDVYILQNGKLYVYEWQNEVSHKLSLGTKPAKLSLVLTRPVSEHP